MGRRSFVAVAVGVLAAGTVLTAGPAAADPPPFAPAATAPITPGVAMITRLDARTAAECTADFVFTAGSALYLGFSAHCTGDSESDDVSGCAAGTLPLGTTVIVRGRDGSETDGQLAYNSWRTMQARGEDDDALCRYNDFALVRLDPADAARVNPSVPRLGGPSGLDTDGLRRGEVVYSFEPNNGGTAVKTGTALGDDPSGRTHQVAITPPGVPGDSGSGFLDADGRAFGVLSTEFFDARHTNGVTDLALALDYADRYGDLGDITLVPGTEPFTPGSRA